MLSSSLRFGACNATSRRWFAAAAPAGAKTNDLATAALQRAQTIARSGPKKAREALPEIEQALKLYRDAGNKEGEAKGGLSVYYAVCTMLLLCHPLLLFCMCTLSFLRFVFFSV